MRRSFLGEVDLDGIATRIIAVRLHAIVRMLKSSDGSTKAFCTFVTKEWLYSKAREVCVKKFAEDGSSQRRECYSNRRSLNTYYCPPKYNSIAFLFSAEVHFGTAEDRCGHWRGGLCKSHE